ncbi:MAG: hypothetical protein IKU18_06910, partial [Bacteroidales bacterium]|nr:hypothetical protein [Bacteroidales bacterium]
SMRRFTHYDYWQDAPRKSILLDSKADILVYGMGEQPITAIAAALKEEIEKSGAEHITAERAEPPLHVLLEGINGRQHRNYGEYPHTHPQQTQECPEPVGTQM